MGVPILLKPNKKREALVETKKYTTKKEKSVHLCLHFKCINLITYVYFQLNSVLSHHAWMCAHTNTQSFYAMFSRFCLMY